MRPRCIVIAGPNGAGKTTFAPLLLGELYRVGRYVNADTIAAGMAGLTPALADRRAGRLALETITAYIAQGVDFAFETTLSGRRWPRLLAALAAAGFEVWLQYLWLPSSDLAVSRVRLREQAGGHAVPEGDVRRRYRSSLENLVRIWWPGADACQVLDASGRPALSLIAVSSKGSDTAVFDQQAWSHITSSGGGPPIGRRIRETQRLPWAVDAKSGDTAGSPEAQRATTSEIDAPGDFASRMPPPEVVVSVYNRAVRRALAIHRALGIGAATWQDGRVVIIPSEELPELPSEERGPVTYRLD